MTPFYYVISADSGEEIPANILVHFRAVCERNKIDFANADPDEREFVIRMAEKRFSQKGA